MHLVGAIEHKNGQGGAACLGFVCLQYKNSTSHIHMGCATLEPRIQTANGSNVHTDSHWNILDPREMF